MLKSSFLEVRMSRFFNRGELRASSIALVTRCSPSPYPVEIIAAPPSRKVVSTSLKSRLIFPSQVISSDIERAAVVRVSSALPNALTKLRSGYMSVSRWLLITSNASTYLLISSAPFRALRILRSPSKRNGIVTMPMVSNPCSLARRATTGAAPVPVPPPIRL